MVLIASALALAIGRSHRPPPRASIANAPPGRQQSCDGRRPGAGPSCGATGDGDCCESRPVPGGTFLRSNDGAGCRDERHPATLSAFSLDTYEVTVGRFRAFVEAGRGTQRGAPAAGEGAHPAIPSSGWDPAWNASLTTDSATLTSSLACHPPFGAWTLDPGPNEALPINCVTWFEAFAFCAWDGGRLPTDAERAYVASGGDEQRVYPWSDPSSDRDIDATRAVFGASRVERVGERPRGNGRWMHADLAGNVWEWTRDHVEGAHLLPSVGADACGSEGYPLPCADCANLDPAPKRVLRGGGFGMPAPGMIASIRRADVPTLRQSVFGLRCVRATATPSAPRADAGACIARCDDRGCGPDGCGGTCGACGGAAACDGAGRCAAYPAGPAHFTEGAVIPSYGFTGVAAPGTGDRTLRTIALADFYNPTGQALFPPGSPWGEGKPKPRALLVDFATGWSEVSLDDVQTSLPAAAARSTRGGGMILLVMLEGARRGQAADVPNLFEWLDRHRITYAAAVDTSLGFARLVTPVPCKAIIDPRTMTIVAIDDRSTPPGAPFWQIFADVLAREP